MAMILDAYANEKNVVTCEERSFFKPCAIDIVVRRRLNPGAAAAAGAVAVAVAITAVVGVGVGVGAGVEVGAQSTSRSN